MRQERSQGWIPDPDSFCLQAYLGIMSRNTPDQASMTLDRNSSLILDSSRVSFSQSTFRAFFSSSFRLYLAPLGFYTSSRTECIQPAVTAAWPSLLSHQSVRALAPSGFLVALKIPMGEEIRMQPSLG